MDYIIMLDVITTICFLAAAVTVRC